MDITHLGHASFKLKGKNATLVTDPYNPSIGLKFPKVEADIVTISHDHRDHNDAEVVDGDPFVISGPGEYEIKDVKIIGVSSFHDEKKGAERGKNTIYNIRIDGLQVCHLGDLGQKELTGEQLEEIGSVDILLIPTGGVYTVDALQAAEIASKFEPRIAIPMHYFEENSIYKLDGVDKFLKEMGAEKKEPLEKLSMTVDKLPEELTVNVLRSIV